MKIFSNFDTNYQKEELKAKMEKYGKDKVLLIKRNFFYLLYYGVLPFIFLAFFEFLFIFLTVKFIENHYLFYGILGFLIIIGLFLFWKIFNIYLDYKYDFTIVSPKGIFTYKQEGLFRCDSKDLPAEEIKSIIATRKGLFGNIFGYGIIEIYTDLTKGDFERRDVGRSQAGKTKLSFVDKPNRIKEKILELCGKD